MADYQGNLNELMRLVDAKDHYTYRHSRNVMSYTVAIARKMATGQRETEDLVSASLFHDVGKFFIPDEILNKPGCLTDGTRWTARACWNRNSAAAWRRLPAAIMSGWTVAAIRCT